jgi:hypothetical protein
MKASADVRADHACAGAHQVDDSVCRELAGSVLHSERNGAMV